MTTDAARKPVDVYRLGSAINAANCSAAGGLHGLRRNRLARSVDERPSAQQVLERLDEGGHEQVCLVKACVVVGRNLVDRRSGN